MEKQTIKSTNAKKVWQTPTVELLAAGYINSGTHAGFHEDGHNPGNGNFYIAPDANPANKQTASPSTYQYFHS